MAQEIVSSLLLKFADVVFKEAITLYRVKDKVESVERKLRWIQSFLKDADSKKGDSDLVQIWVKDVREVSFLIEDVIDTFLLKVERLSLKEPGIYNTLKRLCKKPVKLIAMHNLDSAINNIHARLKEIQENKESFGIENLPESSSARSHVRRAINPEIDNIDLIGVDAEKNNIIKLLLDEHTPRRSVVSIVGIGGLGKTSLAEKVYQSEKVKKHFEVSIWLNVSQEFNTTNLLKKMVKKLINHEEGEQDEEHLMSKIKEVLEGKRYLVVLDDIWTGDLWSEMMMHALPDVNNRSRVLITTRFSDIAKVADPRSHPWELRFLNEEESLNLLFRKACVEKLANGSYPHDLLEPAKTFSKKCGGLPLALVVVGGLLSTKPQTGVAWNKEITTLKWQTGENKCMNILATSFEDLPSNLKSCFIYLASFPEDWVYDAELIIRLWVAEGFIPYDEQCTMEDIAEKYLGELAQRCMIQILEKSIIDGSITEFRVHDLLHDLAIQEAKQKSFLKVFSTRADFENNTDARRATFQLGDSSWEDVSFEQNKLMEYTKPNVRTLIFFGKIIPFGSQFKLLKVLLVQNCSFDDEQEASLKKSLKGLLHLRCLVLRKCRFGHYWYKFYLPTDHLHNLQTLDLQGSFNIVVPMSLLGIKTLRHVHSADIEIEQDPDDLSYLQSLIGRGLAPTDLPNLQTLGRLVIRNSAGIELLNMPNLIRLTLYNDTNSWESIVTLLAKLGCLVSLAIRGRSDLPLGIIDTRSFPSYNLLRTLSLEGMWQLEGVTLNVDMFPPHLTKLTLWRSGIDQDQMPILEKLQCLKVLELSHNAYTGKQMICSRGGFPQLQELTLDVLDELEEWKIEEGAMPMLNLLIIMWCGMLKMVPDLRHVPTLNGLGIKFMPEEFKRRVKNEDQHKIEHIPAIIID